MTTLQADTLIQLGQLLQEVRQGQNLTLPECATSLRIRQTYLQALESGDWQSLPGQAYGRGYLRQYAMFLGLPDAEVMEICDRIQGKLTSRLRYFDLEHTEQTPPFSLLGICLVAGLLVVSGWGVMRYFSTPAVESPYQLTPQAEARLKGEHKMAVIYPPKVQECLKLIQPARTPCYFDRLPEQEMPILAYSNWLNGYWVVGSVGE